MSYQQEIVGMISVGALCTVTRLSASLTASAVTCGM